MARTPAYREITEWLRSEARYRGPRALMPTIAETGERFDVTGVQTVRDAYAPLIEEGLVERLDSPRRWAVVDYGPHLSPTAPDEAQVRLSDVEMTLERALKLVRELRRSEPQPREGASDAGE